MLTTLPDHPTTVEPEPFAGPDHPIRKLTRAVAFGKAWTPDHATRMAGVFDEMAAEWSTRHEDPARAAPIADMLERGQAPMQGSWLELGSGAGAGAHAIGDRIGSLVCTDLSAQMLAHAPDLAPRVRGDASALPYSTDAFDAVLMVNMLLFPHEVDRVVAPGGAVVWINSLGDQTPIHLPAADVLDALPGAWVGTTARAGTGFWLVARRSIET